jgi:hypothetical protein
MAYFVNYVFMFLAEVQLLSDFNILKRYGKLCPFIFAIYYEHFSFN